ncbi:hypothetical protein AURDEDRAFT_146807 [Auricularia subglabra TFB-10046 SS5]|nr:hypothetical protein AURDEDRAFT_146807 [Auricularia subglabra TFB-10046 SS5]
MGRRRALAAKSRARRTPGCAAKLRGNLSSGTTTYAFRTSGRSACGTMAALGRCACARSRAARATSASCATRYAGGMGCISFSAAHPRPAFDATSPAGPRHRPRCSATSRSSRSSTCASSGARRRAASRG